MFCPNCGTQNNDGVKFCANCGNPLAPAAPAAPVQQAVPVQPVAPVQQAVPVQPVPVQPVQQVQYQPVYPAYNPEQQKTNGLCLAGFIVSLVSIVLAGTTSLIGLILSIIGLSQVNKKKQKGKGMAIAGIIISAVFVIAFTLSFFYNYMNKASRRTIPTTRRTTVTEYEETTYSRKTRETTEAETETTTTTEEETRAETTTESDASESRSGAWLESVGNEKTGTVKLTQGKWAVFHEAGGFSSEVKEHEQAMDLNGSIIGLFVLDVTYSPEELAKSTMYSMEQAGAKKVTGARVKLGGYDAVQCYGMYPDGKILVCWYFKGNDGLIRKVTVEFSSDNSSTFSMVEKNYKLDQ